MVYLYDTCDQISDFGHQQLLRKMRRKISWTNGRTDRGKQHTPLPFRGAGYIKNEIETITFLNTIYLGIAAVLGDNVLIGGFIFINKCLEKNTDARRQGPIWYRPSIYFRLFSYF